MVWYFILDQNLILTFLIKIWLQVEEALDYAEMHVSIWSSFDHCTAFVFTRLSYRWEMKWSGWRRYSARSRSWPRAIDVCVLICCCYRCCCYFVIIISCYFLLFLYAHIFLWFISLLLVFYCCFCVTFKYYFFIVINFEFKLLALYCAHYSLSVWYFLSRAHPHQQAAQWWHLTACRSSRRWIAPPLASR